MLSLEWESEGLQTVGIVVIIFASLKLLHLLGLIDFSEGKVVALNRSVGSVCWLRLAELRKYICVQRIKHAANTLVPSSLCSSGSHGL